jgi:hypothetical protein
MQNQSTNNYYVFSEKDPLGNTVSLKKSTLESHVGGLDSHHPERSEFLIPRNQKIIQSVVANPSFILKDKIHENRMNYFDVVALETHSSIKYVKVVTETVGENISEVVTIFPSYSTKNEYFEGRILYDRHGQSEK